MMWGSQGWNQWALQPAMFNDVPHEQIDWAALAKEWIQMQHTEPAESGSQGPPGIPPPHMPPILQEKFSSENVSQPLLKTPAPPEPYSGMGLDAERPFNPEQDNFIAKTPDNSYWNKNNWEPNANADIDERMWAPPPPVAPPISSMLPGKTTFDYGHMHDNPPLAMQTVDYNHMSEYSYAPMYTPPESHYDQYWSQVNVAPSTISPIFLKKERHSSSHVEEDTSHIDAAKRKQLPAWIREGLEKMEQERLKRLEKEKSDKENAEKLSKASSMRKISSLLRAEDSSIIVPVKSKFESDSDLDEENGTDSESLPSKETLQEQRAPSPVEDSRTEEEKKQDLMLKVRRMLTEILLSVTNAEISSIAHEVHKKALSRAPARQLASTTSLTSVASGLCGLASYGSESEASEAEEESKTSDSDDELYQRIKEKRKQFAIKEKKIIADLERQELEEKAEAERIKQENNEKNSNVEVSSIKRIEKEIDDTINPKHEEPTTTSQSISPLKTPSDECEEAAPETDDPIQEFLKLSKLKEEEEEKESKAKNEKKTNKDDENNKSSDSDNGSSSSSSSSTTEESNENHKESKKNRLSKNGKKYTSRKRSVSGKDAKRHKRSRSRDSEISDKRKSSHSSRNKHRSSSKKRKKSKRSESSSSSSSATHKKNLGSKHDHRSRERSSRRHDRSRSNSSSKHSYRSSRKSESYKSSYSRHKERERTEKRLKEQKRYHEHRHSQSPSRQSSRLPKKYRMSRSPSSENESFGKKSKSKSRNR